MEGQPYILCLFQDGVLGEDVVRYAIERARREGEPLGVLMLMAEAADPAMEASLAATAARIRAEGVEVEWKIHVGSKESGVLKHLALSPTPSAIVWGGERSVLLRRRPQGARHWLAKVAPHIHCPIVAPTCRGG